MSSFEKFKQQAKEKDQKVATDTSSVNLMLLVSRFYTPYGNSGFCADKKWSLVSDQPRIGLDYYSNWFA